MRTILICAQWTVAGLVCGLLLAAAAPNLIGYRSFTVLSGSMTPTIRTGDVVIVAPIAPLQARVGEIVAFRDPFKPARLYNHRVRTITRVGSRVSFVTQGDANSGQEHWSVPVSGRIGRVMYRVPAIGFALVYLGNPIVRIALITLPALALLVIELAEIWQRRSGRKPRHAIPA
jgi:signal peptidase